MGLSSQLGSNVVSVSPHTTAGQVHDRPFTAVLKADIGEPRLFDAAQGLSTATGGCCGYAIVLLSSVCYLI